MTNDGVEATLSEALREITGARGHAELEAARIKYLGRRGRITEVLAQLPRIAPEERREYGAAANRAKRAIEEALEAQRSRLEAARFADLAGLEAIDVTFPAPPLPRGHLHVLNQTQREMEVIFERIGYQVEVGPEVETDWYNFEALNLPKGHAARDAQDSFFFTENILLRTQTSPVQIRAMERLGQPPIYVVAPGRVYRRDATDASHLATFTQLEGLAVDRGLTVGDLKGTLLYFVQSMFGPERRLRFRPDYFPFTEPSLQVSVSCGICDGKGCRSCGQSGWLELLGCGMVHPQVLRNGGVDPARYTGFAWGIGVERTAMLKHDIDEIRLLYENDLRFLEQF
jgi:phenylalanyl-tRNA synthetase alpha chain